VLRLPLPPGKDELEDSDYSNPDMYDNLEVYDNSNFDQSKVPPQYIDKIPPNKVDVTLVKDQSKLTANQLVYGTPPNLDKVTDASKLDKAQRDEALRQLGRLQEDVSTDNPNQIQITPDGFNIDYTDTITVGGVKFINCQGVRVTSTRMECDKAAIVDFYGVTNEEVEAFSGDRATREYSLGHAEVVKAGCFEARGVDNADIKINDKIEISVPPEEEFGIVYGFRKEMDFTAKNNTKLIGDPAGCLKEFDLEGQNFNLEIPGDRTEIVEVNDTAIITIDRDLGFVCGQFTPLAKYSSQGDTLEDIFSLVVWKTPHKICARKHVDQVFDIEKEMTLVDFLTSKITINGLVDYRRYFFSNGTLLTPTTTPHFTPEIPFTSILSHDPSWKKATATVASNDIQNTAVFSNFLKVLDQRENTKRFLVFDTNIQSLAENIIQNYQTIAHPLIYATDSIIIQDTNTQAKITILPPNHPDIPTSIKTFK